MMTLGMKKVALILFSVLIISESVNAQIISQFDWDSNPVTTATIGPNAISVSSSAVSDAGGVGGTNGLNPNLSGTPKLDVDLILTGSPTFDVPGIDFSIDYHREESSAEFFRRGSSLIISAGNQFNVTYRVDDGAGGFNTVSSGNVYPIPNDDTYRTYRFYYLPATGEGFLTVDGVQIWTNDGPDNRNMYWTGAGNITIGNSLDGSGNNDTHLDNMIIGSVTNSALPIELTSFTVKPEKSTAVIEWTTASEINNDYFEIEKSADGNDWQKLAKIDGSGNSSKEINYEYIDHLPILGISYYRLKQIDFDGHLEIFEPISFSYSERLMHISELFVFPNPANDFINIQLNYSLRDEISIFNTQGKLMTTLRFNDQDEKKIEVDVGSYPPGLYIVTDGESSIEFIKN